MRKAVEQLIQQDGSVEFTSLQNLIEGVHSLMHSPADQWPARLTVRIGSNSDSIADLYRLGRLLSFARLAKTAFGVPVDLRCQRVNSLRTSHLHQLGLPEYCSDNGIAFHPQSRPASQRRLPPLTEAFGDKVYWYCLHPLTTFRITPDRDESEALARTNEILEDVSNRIRDEALPQLNLSSGSIDLELNRIIFGVLKELIVNAVLHSGSDGVTVAVTMSRETDTSGRAHRPGRALESGQDKFEVLVMDHGEGVFRTVLKKLGVPDDSHSQAYFSMTPWDESFRVIKQEEEALLKSIFHGNLAVRKGRKSEGMHDVADRVEWFGGILNYRTGRSELQVEGPLAGSHVRRDRFDYLPGVVASALLPSHQVRLLMSRSKASPVTRRDRGNTGKMPCVLACPPLPEGLFGGQTKVGSQRRCELYARELTEFYRTRAGTSVRNPCFMEIDLSLSRAVSVDFLDTLIQELCKATTLRRPGEPDYTRRLFFSNVRRSVIRALQQRNCRSLLMMSETVCLFLDEEDHPHLLGTPRVTRGQVHEVSDLMSSLFLGEEASEDWLRDSWKFDDHSVIHLRKLIRPDREELFYRAKIGDEIVYRAQDITTALERNRRAQVDKIREFVVGAESNSIVKTQNTCFDSWIDFPSMWGDVKRLTDSARLLAATGEVTSAHAVLGFMHNGDRLAGAVQLLSGAPRLVIVDPRNRAAWDQAELDGDYTLVLDALYPQDEEGYVGGFIRAQASKGRRPKSVIAFADLRKAAEGSRDAGFLDGLPVVSLVDATHKGMPRMVEPTEDSLIVRMGEQRRDLGPPHGRTPGAGQPKPSARRREYSDEELSAEFWHNASTFDIIASRRTGREGRDILFYENNERIIENQRTRTLLEEFVADFVRDRLGLRVDVIVHPSHPAGAFLAQLVARQLSTPPLILPLSQREYGGRIEMSREEYAWYRKGIEEQETARGRSGLSALLVDDSILTGSSIVTMLGLADLLGLRTRGVLVLVNRLPRGVSAAFEALPSEFGYLYRLHMPVLSALESPDVRMREWSQRLRKAGSSFFVGHWCDVVSGAQEGSYFLRDDQMIATDQGLRLPDGDLDVFDDSGARPACVSELMHQERDDDWVQRLQPHEVRQVIDGLLLHQDPSVLDFFTRMAAAYNFLEHLVEEPPFWQLLQAWADLGISTRRETNEVYFVRKLVYLMAFSRHTGVPHVARCLRRFCRDTLLSYVDTGAWVDVPDIVCECLVALGAANDEWIVSFGHRLVEAMGRLALGEVTDDAGRARDRARQILAAYAWSVNSIPAVQGTELYGFARNGICHALAELGGDGELQLLLLDIYETYVRSDPPLRARLGIETWNSQDTFLQDLLAVDRPAEHGEAWHQGSDGRYPDNSMFRYLTDALGYTFTLKSVLMICKADTVVLFAKSRSDAQFYVRDYETRNNFTPDPNLSSEHLTDERLPGRIRSRMAQGLFIFSDEPAELATLKDFSSSSDHLWMLGARVRERPVGEQYYVLLGYSGRPWTEERLRTAYYYWLQCESLLEMVLPAIHERHIVSSTAWHALIQSIAPLHPIRPTGSHRRRLVAMAIGQMNLGDLLRRAVATSRRAALRPSDVLYSVDTSIKLMETRIKQAAEVVQHTEDEAEALTGDNWPVRLVTVEQDLPDGVGYISFHNTILDFVLHECLCNALVNSVNRVDVALSLIRHAGPVGRDVLVVLAVDNDRAEANVRPEVSGIAACMNAARAVGGTFVSEAVDESRWHAELRLPGYSVPTQLTVKLRELLKVDAEQ
jgi:adenine/guanine phosphoribosyltransferase-like PRPP-binding protein